MNMLRKCKIYSKTTSKQLKQIEAWLCELESENKPIDQVLAEGNELFGALPYSCAHFQKFQDTDIAFHCGWCSEKLNRGLQGNSKYAQDEFAHVSATEELLGAPIQIFYTDLRAFCPGGCCCPCFNMNDSAGSKLFKKHVAHLRFCLGMLRQVGARVKFALGLGTQAACALFESSFFQRGSEPSFSSLFCGNLPSAHHLLLLHAPPSAAPDVPGVAVLHPSYYHHCQSHFLTHRDGEMYSRELACSIVAHRVITSARMMQVLSPQSFNTILNAHRHLTWELTPFQRRHLPASWTTDLLVIAQVLFGRVHQRLLLRPWDWHALADFPTLCKCLTQVRTVTHLGTMSRPLATESTFQPQNIQDILPLAHIGTVTALHLVRYLFAIFDFLQRVERMLMKQQPELKQGLIGLILSADRSQTTHDKKGVSS